MQGVLPQGQPPLPQQSRPFHRHCRTLPGRQSHPSQKREPLHWRASAPNRQQVTRAHLRDRFWIVFISKAGPSTMPSTHCHLIAMWGWQETPTLSEKINLGIWFGCTSVSRKVTIFMNLSAILTGLHVFTQGIKEQNIVWRDYVFPIQSHFCFRSRVGS